MPRAAYVVHKVGSFKRKRHPGGSMDPNQSLRRYGAALARNAVAVPM